MKLPRTLSASLDKVARDAIGRDWALYATLIEHWREIVGEEYAKTTAPVKITFPKGKKPGATWAGGQSEGTLTLRLPQGLAMSFSFLSETMMARINAFFGYPAITRIVLEPFYTTEPAHTPQPDVPLSPDEKTTLSKSLKSVENEELREILHQLGESVIKERLRE